MKKPAKKPNQHIVEYLAGQDENHEIVSTLAFMSRGIGMATLSHSQLVRRRDL